MRLAEIMSRDVRTARPTDRLDDARRTLESNRVHHLVVMDGGRAVGVISARDLARGGGSVGDAMSPNPVVATSKTTVRQAANLMRGNLVGCLPVVDAGKLVGIVTTSDLLELLGRGAWKGPVGQIKPMWRRGPRRKPARPDKRRA